MRWEEFSASRREKKRNSQLSQETTKKSQSEPTSPETLNNRRCFLSDPAWGTTCSGSSDVLVDELTSDLHRRRV